MSFRDQIKNILNDFYGEVEGVYIPYIMAEEHNKYTDEILKLFEKRVNELWNKKQKQIYSTFQQSPTYESAYEEAIEEIKEILKK